MQKIFFIIEEEIETVLKFSKATVTSSHPKVSIGKGALKVRQKIYRRTPMPKCDFNKVPSNFIEMALSHGCFPVNLLHIFRTTFPRNTSGWLLLNS